MILMITDFKMKNIYMKEYCQYVDNIIPWIYLVTLNGDSNNHIYFNFNTPSGYDNEVHHLWVINPYEGCIYAFGQGDKTNEKNTWKKYVKYLGEGQWERLDNYKEVLKFLNNERELEQ